MNNVLKTIMLLTIMITTANADSLYTGLHTFHIIENGYDYYEANNVLLYELDNGINFGKMTNSFENESYFLGYRHKFNKYMNAGMLLATGYTQNDVFGNDVRKSIPLLPMPFVGLELPLTKHVSLSTQWTVIVINSGVIISF